MFLSKKRIMWRIALLIVLLTLAGIASALMLYYSNTHVLNSVQSYKGIFI